MTTLTASEAAAALGCSRRWLRELATRGVLIVVDKGGGRGNQTTYYAYLKKLSPSRRLMWMQKAKESAK